MNFQNCKKHLTFPKVEVIFSRSVSSYINIYLFIFVTEIIFGALEKGKKIHFQYKIAYYNSQSRGWGKVPSASQVKANWLLCFTRSFRMV